MATAREGGNYDDLDEDFDSLLETIQNLGEATTKVTPENWKQTAKSVQQRFCELLGDRDYDLFLESDIEYLERKIGFALFGPPREDPTEQKKSEKGKRIGYEEVLEEEIREVVKFIRENGANENKIFLSTVFVKMYIPGQPLIPEPVFRIPKVDQRRKEDGEYTFIDRNRRKYASWSNYLEENLLPRCDMCYPANGIYERDAGNSVLVKFGKSPACKWQNEALEVMDKANMAASLGLTVVGLASLAIPIAGPILAATAVGGLVSGGYAAGRGISALVDRATHGQRIGIGDAESRGCWLSIGGSLVFMSSSAATGIVTNMARQGRTIGTATCLAVDALTVGALTVNGLGIVHGAYTLYMKSKTEKLSNLELFQFASSILFFTNSAMNVQTTKSLFLNAQKNTLNEYRDGLRSNRHRKQFDRLSRNTRSGMNRMEGDAKVIRSVRHIGNKDDFFAGAVRTQKQFSKTRSRATFTDTGNIRINRQLEVDPMDFSRLNKNERITILNATKGVNSGSLSNAQYQKVLGDLFQRNNIPYNAQTPIVVTTLYDVFGTISLKEVVINGKNIFSQMNDSHWHFLGRIIENIDFRRVFRLAAGMANKMGCETAEEFFKFMEFACPYFSNIYKEFLSAYYTLRDMPQSREFSEAQFVKLLIILLRNIYNIGSEFRKFKEEYQRFRRSQNYSNNSNPDGDDSNNDVSDSDDIIDSRFEEMRKRDTGLKPKVFGIVAEIAIKLNFVKPDEFFDFVEFAHPYVECEMEQVELEYQNMLSEAMNAGLSEQVLKESCGIVGDRDEYFVLQVKQVFTADRIQRLKEDYENFSQTRRKFAA